MDGFTELTRAPMVQIGSVVSTYEMTKDDVIIFFEGLDSYVVFHRSV